jgi:hypothetical protein
MEENGLPEDVATEDVSPDRVDESDSGGTGFKSNEELVTGYKSLLKKLGEQGNELGTHRKDAEFYRTQAETLQSLLKEQMGKPQAAPQKSQGIDYDSEIAGIEQQIQTLDPMEDGYQKTLASLVAKSNKLTAAAQHEKTLGAASEMFRKELSDRDTKAARDAFYRENPTFNTPETQAKIRDYLANDRTGMSDPLVAFREIQRDEAAAKAAALEAENAEYKKLIELNKGKDEAGKVVVKGQSPGQQQTKQPKVTGKDLDAGMAAALRSLG